MHPLHAPVPFKVYSNVGNYPQPVSLSCPILTLPPSHHAQPKPNAGANKDAPLPVKLFEVSDVILLTGGKGCGAANRRRLVAVHCDRAASFEIIHGLLNRVMEVLSVPYAGAAPIVLRCATF